MTNLDHNTLPTVVLTLEDGSEAELRPLTSSDANLLRDGLSHLSEESRRNRFGVGVDRLSAAEIKYLTDVDQIHHVAWGATIQDEPAGIGRYILLDDPGCAEIAVTVIDEFQRLGLGTMLLKVLAASARYNRVEEFCFWVEPDNQAVLRMLEGIETRLDDGDGLIGGRIPLADISPLDDEEEIRSLLARYQL